MRAAQTTTATNGIGYSSEQRSGGAIRDFIATQGADPLTDPILLESGQVFDPRPLPDRRWIRTAGRSCAPLACCINAQRAGFEHGWDYVEGWAINVYDPYLQFHCWNLDEDGRMLDTTWPDEGIAYFGVVVPQAEWMLLTWERGFFDKILPARVRPGWSAFDSSGQFTAGRHN